MPVLPVNSSKISGVGMSLQTGTAFAVVDVDEEDGARPTGSDLVMALAEQIR
jgi:hypothetical protein